MTTCYPSLQQRRLWRPRVPLQEPEASAHLTSERTSSDRWLCADDYFYTKIPLGWQGSAKERDQDLFSGTAFATMLLHMYGEDLSIETQGMTVQEAYFDAGIKLNHLTVDQVAYAALWVSSPFH